MAILKPDKTTTLGGVTVNEYLLTEHNPNKISMPTVSMKGKVLGVTVHNTDWIKTASGTTPAEQYTRATYNGNMKDVRVHYYVDHKCAWQNLPLDLSGRHAADGDGNGNRRTIAIECIMSPAYNVNDKASEDNCARLAAALLRQYGLGIESLYTHNHWYSKKYCPAYILPHWAAFKAKVEEYLTNGSEKAENAAEKQQMYRVRKAWDDVKSQEGAYKVLENAKKKRDELGGEYTVYDADGKAVYPAEPEEYKVRVSIPNLNIRTGPGMQHPKTGRYTGKGVFTIVETQGSWGRLKAGGWISLEYGERV